MGKEISRIRLNRLYSESNIFAGLMVLYSGIMTLQPTILLRRAFGRPPDTSARPPEAAKGRASLVANNTFISLCLLQCLLLLCQTLLPLLM